MPEDLNASNGIVGGWKRGGSMEDEEETKLMLFIASETHKEAMSDSQYYLQWKYIAHIPLN